MAQEKSDDDKHDESKQSKTRNYCWSTDEGGGDSDDKYW